MRHILTEKVFNPNEWDSYICDPIFICKQYEIHKVGDYPNFLLYIWTENTNTGALEITIESGCVYIDNNSIPEYLMNDKLDISADYILDVEEYLQVENLLKIYKYVLSFMKNNSQENNMIWMDDKTVKKIRNIIIEIRNEICIN